MFECIQRKSQDIDEFVEWLSENGRYDYSAWEQWWDENYCNKCGWVSAYLEEFDKVCDCAWCEANGKCKYFQELDDIPDIKQIIKLWLESEVTEVTEDEVD
jgi:hypothetical protein